MWRGLQFVVEGGDREMRPAVDWAMRAFPEAAVDAAGSAVHVMVRSSGDGEPVGVSIRRAPEESQTVVSLMGSVRAQTVGWVVLMKQNNAPMNCTPMTKAVCAVCWVAASVGIMPCLTSNTSSTSTAVPMAISWASR